MHTITNLNNYAIMYIYTVFNVTLSVVASYQQWMSVPIVYFRILLSGIAGKIRGAELVVQTEKATISANTSPLVRAS